MIKKILSLFVITCFITSLQAQSNKSVKAYAITAAQKGQSSWKEIRQIDIKTGEATQTVYSSTQDIQTLNARTGMPVRKKDMNSGFQNRNMQVFTIDADNKAHAVSSNEELEKLKADGNRIVIVKNESFNDRSYDKPFATNSAALAYDKKHERLYYTPMGINQLRYIDLKSKTPAIYYFEDEPFGFVKNTGDISNQITRMVIASDGNGYALPNNAEHLIRFTTGKKPEITDLGAVTDAPGNGDFSIHRGVGGDMIADKAGNLYLITAYRNVWKINIKTMIAEYKGSINGLPDNYQTNGAIVEEGNKVIVCSGTSTAGYYHFDLNDLNATKISGDAEVFNASDLANGNLATGKKEKETKDEPVPTRQEGSQALVQEINTRQDETSEANINGILVYPNPVTDGIVKLSFNDQPKGKYNVQLLDMNGKIISSQQIVINSKTQIQELKLPAVMGKGTYLVKVISEDNKTNIITKLTVQ